MMKISIIVIALLNILLGQTGFEIAKMVDEKPTPKDMSNRTKMVLTNTKGRTSVKEMISKSMDNNKKQIIWFMEPKDDRGVAFMKIEHEGKDDEMRMWLPAFKKVRRISSRKKGDSFMGSDMSYEDLTNRDLKENDYNRLEDELIKDIDCYVLEIIPKKSAKSTYSKHISWIAKEGLYGVKEESYDKRGKLQKKKKYWFQKLKDYYIIERISVIDVQKDHSTEVSFLNVKVDSGINTRLFHEKNLKRMPRN